MTSCQPKTACHPWSGRWCAPFSDRLTWSVALPDAPLDACIGVEQERPRPSDSLRGRALMSRAQTGVGRTGSPPLKPPRSSACCQHEIFIFLTAGASFSAAFTIRKQKNVEMTWGLKGRETVVRFGFFMHESQSESSCDAGLMRNIQNGWSSGAQNPYFLAH